jgi:hypothetical protein
MYACMCESYGGICEGVCTPSSATAYSRDPPPPRDAKEPEPHNGVPGGRDLLVPLRLATLLLG